MCNWRGRRMLYGKWLRLTHWVFSPVKIVYLPVGYFILLLATRYRSLTLFTISSPAIPHSGFAMDSMGDILDLFPNSRMIPAYLIMPVHGEPGNRVFVLSQFMLESPTARKSPS